MRNGGVIRYAGRRGVVWRIRYRDADGQRITETLGRDADGWTENKAKEELRNRLVDVKREGRRKLKPVTFKQFANQWIDEYPAARSLKRSTSDGYRAILNRHLIPALGHLKLPTHPGEKGAVDVGTLERYVAAKRKAGLEPRTINRHLNLLSAMFGTALRRGLVASNPVALVERPREPRRRWTILSPTEVSRIERAFTELANEAVDELERAWIDQARVVFLTVLLAGLRRGEILGLRWRHVFLADPEGARLEVRETVVHGHAETPKSERAERTIALGQRLASALFEHRGRTPYHRDDERVFCTQTGGVLDPVRYAATLKLAMKRAKVEKAMRPFHDGRHSSITNAAAAGTAPAALQARAGHSDFSTTQLYIDLAGETFREEAERLEDRMFATGPGKSLGKS